MEVCSKDTIFAFYEKIQINKIIVTNFCLIQQITTTAETPLVQTMVNVIMVMTPTTAIATLDLPERTVLKVGIAELNIAKNIFLKYLPSLLFFLSTSG